MCLSVNLYDFEMVFTNISVYALLDVSTVLSCCVFLSRR